jgi:hypothetical protein
MFSLKVVETDKFLDMPTSAQCLYFHLGMHGDDEGFVASPRKITSMCGCNPDDLKILVSKGFIYPFESGVCVITDWRVNNTLKNDRFTPSIYVAEKVILLADNPAWFQDGSKMVPQHNITEHSITKKRERKTDKPSCPRFIPPSVEEVSAYCQERGNSIDPQYFVDYYSTNAWIQGKGKPITDWKACVRTWERRDKVNQVSTQEAKKPKTRIERQTIFGEPIDVEVLVRD